MIHSCLVCVSVYIYIYTHTPKLKHYANSKTTALPQTQPKRRFATLGLHEIVKQQPTLTQAKRRIATTSTKAFPQAISRFLGFRHDLGSWEYTVYIYAYII